MLGGLDRGDLAQRAVGQRGNQVPVQGRIAQHEADHHAVGAAMARKQVEQLEGLGLRGDDRLFAEDAHAQFQPRPDVLQVQMVGRADQQQFGLPRLCHRLDAFISGAGLEGL